MNILLIGATGMIGSRILEEAKQRGHAVTAAVRNPERVTPHQQVAPTAFDLADAPRFQELAARADVVVAAVSPRNTGNPETEALAYADALIAGVGTTRLVLVGGAGSLNLPDGTPVANVVPEPYTAEAKGMRAAFEKIAASTVNYTVLAPAAEIAPGTRTNQFRTGGRTFLVDDQGQSRISAEDYAVALMNEVEQPAHPRQLFSVAY
ncbi:NAD(P)-dependent oxidoreductase [Acanthopleuribacter pedis]|uniref:NAD(P)H-binding protein n=1 Tax=Acanthopleuribacter pedis TaxID=442870 RepID=A0A8J7U4E0_9BACT|nr:NAD(P)H-binding protein [Acanthopleuribacter pedis]MBO1319333.1 NAD(P)H-binding protein [Acanthopleuribacter pedis]